MSTTAVTGLTTITTSKPADWIHVVQDGVDYKIALSNILHTGNRNGMLLLDASEDATSSATQQAATATIYGVVTLFDAATLEAQAIRFEVPPDFDDSVNPILRLTLYPAANQSSGSDFKFGVECKYVATDGTEQVDKAADETVTNTVTVDNNQDIVTKVDLTLDASLMAAGDVAMMRVYRDAADAADDRNGDAAVIRFTFHYAKTII